MSSPPDVSGSARERAAPKGVGTAAQGRSPAQIAWRRLRRDRLALAGAVVILLLVLVAIFAPLVVALLGHPPDEFHYAEIDANRQVSPAPFGGISTEFLFGVEPINGRDVFSRVVYGARISLLIAFLATLLSVVLGTVAGVVAGYFGGWVDAVISRSMDAVLAFPLLLLALALVGVLRDEAFGLRGDTLRIAVIVLIIGFSGWPYIGRIVRGQTLSLREREFVEAARGLGAGNSRILFTELLPNLVAPILVYSTLLIPTNVLFEAALSYLGVGIRPPTPSWGGMLSAATRWYEISPNYVAFPGLAIFVTVLAFNLFGDGLRDALDPRSR